ncbi:hypothetical protein D3C74_343090 [compost metagenome]
MPGPGRPGSHPKGSAAARRALRHAGCPWAGRGRREGPRAGLRQGPRREPWRGPRRQESWRRPGGAPGGRWPGVPVREQRACSSTVRARRTGPRRGPAREVRRRPEEPRTSLGGVRCGGARRAGCLRGRVRRPRPRRALARGARPDVDAAWGSALRRAGAAGPVRTFPPDVTPVLWTTSRGRTLLTAVVREPVVVAVRAAPDRRLRYPFVIAPCDAIHTPCRTLRTVVRKTRAEDCSSGRWAGPTASDT